MLRINEITPRRKIIVLHERKLLRNDKFIIKPGTIFKSSKLPFVSFVGELLIMKFVTV